MPRALGVLSRALEPGLNAHAAILSPESGVFDSHGYMLALQGEIEDAGGAVVIDSTGSTVDDVVNRILVLARGAFPAI